MKRITVIVKNNPGAVADVCGVLADGAINIVDIDANVTDATGALNLTVDRDYDRALILLRDAGFPAVSEDAIVVRIKDEPGGIAKIAQRFKAANINLRSLHIMSRQGDYALVALATEHTSIAVELVKDVIISSEVIR